MQTAHLASTEEAKRSHGPGAGFASTSSSVTQMLSQRRITQELVKKNTGVFQTLMA